MNHDQPQLTPAERRAVAAATDLYRITTEKALSDALSADTRRAINAAVAPQLDGVMKDFKASYSSVQINTAKIAQNLLRNVDFDGLMASFAQDWFKHLKFNFGAMARVIYPANLRAVDGANLDILDQILMAEGIALYGVPRAEIVGELVDAPDALARREILDERWQEIAEDCRALLDTCASAEAQSGSSFARAAVTALEDGHTEAAQALVGTLTDTLVGRRFRTSKGEIRGKFTSRKAGVSDAAYDKVVFSEYVAFAPMWAAYQQYKPENNDPIPTTFNRHATVHGVGPEQYSRLNAVQGLMFICGAVKRIDQEPDFLAGNPDWDEQPPKSSRVGR